MKTAGEIFQDLAEGTVHSLVWGLEGLPEYSLFSEFQQRWTCPWYVCIMTSWSCCIHGLKKQTENSAVLMPNKAAAICVFGLFKQKSELEGKGNVLKWNGCCQLG